MIPIGLLPNLISVSRRSSTGRDTLNNPTYGAPTSGSGWNIIYSAIQCRLAFSTKQVRFAPEGERILPTGVVYLNTGPVIQQEDRVITETGIEYNVISVVPATGINGQVDHLEIIVQLP